MDVPSFVGVKREPANASPWWFDLRLFGSELRAARLQAGLSTRHLAQAAAISQAYVVALEGSTSSRGPVGPCPSVQVLVAIASALGLEPAEFMGRGLRPVGRHVLLVIDDESVDLLAIARDVGGDVETWVTSGHLTAGSDTPHIGLRPTGHIAWDLDVVGPTIHAGLQGLGEVVRDRRVGIVFSDYGPDLVQGGESLLSIERDWAGLISSAAWAAGARSAASICIYQQDALSRMDLALDTTLDLISSHEAVCVNEEGKTLTGQPATTRLLERLRPRHETPSQWRQTCARRLRQTGTGPDRPRTARRAPS